MLHYIRLKSYESIDKGYTELKKYFYIVFRVSVFGSLGFKSVVF